MAAVLTESRTELEAAALDTLRKTLRDRKILWGYPSAYIGRQLAISLLAGEISREEACRRMVAEGAPEGVVKWIATNEPFALPEGLQTPDSAPEIKVRKLKAQRIIAARPKTESAPELPEDWDAYTDNLKMERPDGKCPWGVDPDFHPSEKHDLIYRYLDNDILVFLVGPAGSGKTMGFQWYCKNRNRKMMMVSLHAHMPATELFGEQTLDIQDGVNCLRWVPGVVEIAMREGAILILDEFDRAPYALQLALNDVAANRRLSFTKGPYAGRTLYAREGFMLLATGNTLKPGSAQYVSNGVESSTLDRFKVLHVSYDESAERRLLTKMGIQPEVATKIQRAVREARESFNKKHLLFPIGTRRIKALASDIQMGIPVLAAWEINIANMQHQDRGAGTHWEKAMEIGKDNLSDI